MSMNAASCRSLAATRDMAAFKATAARPNPSCKEARTGLGGCSLRPTMVSRFSGATSAETRVVREPLKYHGRARNGDCSPPPHRSRRALLTHRAPTSGHGVEPPVGIGVPQLRAGQPTFRDPHHFPPRQPMPLASPPESAQPVGEHVAKCCCPARGPDRRPLWRPRNLPPLAPWRIHGSPHIHQKICYSNRGRDAHC
jgi:hypothetical protein